MSAVHQDAFVGWTTHTYKTELTAKCPRCGAMVYLLDNGNLACNVVPKLLAGSCIMSDKPFKSKI